jgi:hypothetical protein
MAYVDYFKFCKDETDLPLSNTKFGLILKSVVDIHKISQNNKMIRYYQIKDDVQAKYDIENESIELDDIECI